MGFNIHGLAFKQSMMILVGISLVLAVLFGVLSFQVQNRLSALLSEKGEEISQANVAIIENLFESGKEVGDELAERIGVDQPAGKDLDDFLNASLFHSRAKIPQVFAVVVAYEPGMAPKADSSEEVMRLAKYSGPDIILLNGGNYQNKNWYKSTKEMQKGIWQEPFIGDFIKEPIAIYTAPIYHRGPDGSRVFAGVLCVDVSIAFLKDFVASIPVANSGYAVVLSAKNTVIAHPRSDIIFKESLESLSGKRANKHLSDFEKALREMKNGLFVGRSPEGEETAIYFTTMKTNGWTFMIVWPAKKFMESQRSMEHMFGWISVGGYAVMLVFVLIISFRVSRPLKKLALAANKLACGDFDAEIPETRGRDEVAQFAFAFSNMRMSLKEYIGKQKDLDRIERELELSKSIQLGILPKDEDEEQSRDDRHELAPFLLPAKEVGGDFYDFFKLDNEHLCVMVGDVSGKGVPAALFMMVSRILLRTMVKDMNSVADAFNSANFGLARRNKSDMFVTVWMGIVDLRTGHVEYASAGHNPPVVRHSDGSIDFVQCKPGLVMAAMEDTVYKTHSFDLKPGDMLFLYTDGVVEATNARDELFGEQRLVDALHKGENLNASETCALVKKELDEFVAGSPQFDDITMLSLKFNGDAKPVWERFEKTVGVAENGQSELKSFVEGIFPPMDGSMKVRMQNAWERYEKIVDVVPENQDVLTSFVEEILSPMEGSMKSQMQINIAIDEIYSNIVKFSGATSVTLVVEVRKATLTAKLTFIDDGSPYDPLKNKDPDVSLSAEEREIGGLGIFIVKKTMDSVSYRRNGDKNELVITKTL